MVFTSLQRSDVLWEEKKRWNHYKAVSTDLKNLLEKEYDRAKQEGAHGVVAIPDSDFKVRKRGEGSGCMWTWEGGGGPLKGQGAGEEGEGVCVDLLWLYVRRWTLLTSRM